MWVFDGEEWRKDDGSEESTTTSVKPGTATPYRIGEFVPELQVIEIPVPQTRHVPPFPLADV